MNTITTRDGTEIYYKDWGKGQPIVFGHGWPLCGDAFEDQMFFLARRGYRCIAHDRRGHGRSGQPWAGNDMNTYADDLATLVETLRLKNAIYVGHSTGAGEITRYIGRHGSGRAAKVVLIGAASVAPRKGTISAPDSSTEAPDRIRAALLEDRAQFFKELAVTFYGYNRAGSALSEGARDVFWAQAMMCGFPAAYDSIAASFQTDLSEDFKRIDVPTLVLHGEDDQIVPLDASALRWSPLIKNARRKIYKGAPHGMYRTLKNRINADLLAFFQGERHSESG